MVMSFGIGHLAVSSGTLPSVGWVQKLLLYMHIFFFYFPAECLLPPPKLPKPRSKTISAASSASSSVLNYVALTYIYVG